MYSLYYTLNVDIPKKSLTIAAKKKLQSAINKMTAEHCEVVFLLICEHYRCHAEDKAISSIPYEGCASEGGTTFDLNKLPSDLQWVIQRFVTYITDKIDK